ncbi:RHS repeat-associated protein [Pseudomonas putida]|uniref:RHS repeat domain-containing protein n=1 Tax=Pseudomonas putida TaxID=303 RepID=UPI001049894E|nr:RHS repeat-associated core domain-containing protein [Pseudomonas putida]TCP69980.1 RHS repeat-associated protein [Pseudomonas putida]
MSSVIHSNAANFKSFLQNGVDPRTGQYTLAIALPALAGNDLIGPQLPLRLAFNPLNDQDSGFGKGWELSLTQYVPGTHMLTLHSGETFKVTGSGAQPGIREKKLDTFHFHDDTAEGGDRYRVVHKSGLVEILTNQGGTTPVYRPTEIRSPAGHAVSLSYSSNPVRLETLSYRDADSQVQQLLKLTYSTGAVTIDLHPNAAQDKLYHARYTLQMLNRELNKIILPGEEGANWRIEYGTVRNLLCVRKVWTPAGAEEHVTYEDEGHVLPANGQRAALPRVTTHTVYPGAGQPPLKTTYTYKHFDTDNQQWLDHNFVGYNSGITWQDNGEDNLYRAQPSYQYSVTAHFWDGDSEMRTCTQTYNRHHLLVRQALEQDGHIEETLTQYHEQPDTPFDDQPPYFQLPHVITKRWTLRSDPFKQRVEQVTTLYDDAGNLIEEVQPTGIHTRYAYYHEQGETGEDGTCPPDPENFRRNLKCSTVYPVGLQGDAPVMRTRLSYKAYSPLAGITNPWLAISEERQFQVIDADHANESEQLLQRVEREYLETPDDAYLHGRPDHQATTRYGNDLANPLRKAIESRTTRTRWRYRKVRDDKWGLEHWRDTTVSGFDLEQMSTSEAASALDGQQTYRQDGTGNAVRITYDVLGRVTEETVAPGTPDETRTVYGYTLVAATGEKATQWVTESTGVMSIMTLDGCNRPVQEERETAALAGRAQVRSKRLVSESRYDGLGQLRGLTIYDYYQTSAQAAEKVIEQTSSFDYDAWGELCKTTQADGVTLHRERTPFGADGDQITEWMETPDRPDERQQHTVTETNNFGKPARRFRVGSDGQILGRRVFDYDGLGHCTDEARYIEKPDSTARTSRRTSRYQFDPHGRITQTEQPDKSAVLRDFALHSGDELTERLRIRPRNSSNDQVVCDRDFDGVSRLTSLTMGARRETYTYVENTLLPHTRTTASNRTFTYAYQASLSPQPKSISIATSVNADAPHQATFDYHPLTAAINDATNAQGTRSYLYTDQGYLEQAVWDDSITGEHYSCDYSHSLQGLPLRITTSDGESVSHTYDTLGRLETTRQGDLLATFSYDSAGRLHSTETEDAANQQQVVCKQYYDDLGRQTSRTQTLTRTDGTTLTHALELAWRSDDQLHSRTLSRDGSKVLHESFDYDVLDRLEHHRFEGSELPCNAQGRPIVSQFFIYDDLNNLTECYTDFADGSMDVATYSYDGFLLREATHTLQPDYPARQAFSHDDDGNLLNDEQGNRLRYDPVGRLVEVRSADDSQLLHSYRYDGHGDLVGATQGNASEVQRRYQGYRLSSTVENGLLTQYLYAADHPAGLQQSGTASGTRLLLTDHVGSVIAESDGSTLEQARYNAYGENLTDSNLQGLLGFNGEARERALGWYLLGRGYRAYNPVLMRFHSPDELYPEAAGINPYSYCGGNPVNWRDPSGHVGERYSMELPYIPPTPAPKPKKDWRSWLGVALGAVFVVVSLIFLPPVGFTLAFAAGASSLGLDIASTAASAVAAANGDETANNWAFWLGIASAVSTLGIMAMSRFMTVKTATSEVATRSVATQTDDVVGSVTKNIDLTQPRSIFGPTSNLPSRRFNNYVRKFTTGNGQTKFSELDSLDSIPLTGDRNNIRNPIFKPDKNAAPRIVAANEVITEGATTLTVTPPSPTLAEWTPAAGIAGWGRRVVDGIVKYESGMFLPDYRPPGI